MQPKYPKTVQAVASRTTKLLMLLDVRGECAEYARGIAGRTAETGFMTGRTTLHVAAASILLACRRHSVAITLDDVATAARIGRGGLWKTYRALYDAAGVELPIPDPIPYLTKINKTLNLDDETNREAASMLASLDADKIIGKDPAGVAAAVMYAACVKTGQPVMQRDIVVAAGVSKSTLSSRYADMFGGQP